MPRSLCAVLSLFLLLVVGCAGRPLHHHKKPLQTSRPYNIAHRGSNGEFPEETVGAYMRAIEEGADFIESDVLASKDGVLICFHDVTLDATTDIADHKEFAKRRRTYEVQQENVTGWFTGELMMPFSIPHPISERGNYMCFFFLCNSNAFQSFKIKHGVQIEEPPIKFTFVIAVDFTLEELQSLRVKQRFKFRDQQYNWKYSIITFEEFISIALDAPRTVGIYPEIKNPVFINQHIKWADEKKFEDRFVETLQKYGYKGSYLSKEWKKQPVFIQSFAPTSLIHISNFTDLPKILLIDDVTIPTQDTNQSYSEVTSDKYLGFIKNYVVGIGPWKDTIVPVRNNYLDEPTDLVAKAHAHDLQVHPYTYRNENQYLHFNFHEDPHAEYDYWINKIRVDGLFTDFAGTLHEYQECRSRRWKDESAVSLVERVAELISSYRNEHD
ncbi:hypothetical protein Scep_016448 [Stephania cephalantha]|uniref:glycerophosphodiester phosphodiesterase n=1 Tax=Stephania cephalantha TaxID=152367 RepID=A0AAP0IN83_9MAGN